MDPTPAPTAAAVLQANGMTGAALLKLAYQCANHYANRHSSFPTSRIEDLAQHCCMHVLRRAPKYRAELNNFDPSKNPKSTPIRSWAWMQMCLACGDFVRQRKEGFAGRIGRDREITMELTDSPEKYEDPAAELDELVADRGDARRWREAAQAQGKSLEAFVFEALEAAAA